MEQTPNQFERTCWPENGGMRVSVCFCAQSVWRKGNYFDVALIFQLSEHINDRTLPFKKQLVNTQNNKQVNRLFGLVFVADDKGFLERLAGSYCLLLFLVKNDTQ
jgi:hypothetical protein